MTLKQKKAQPSSLSSVNQQMPGSRTMAGCSLWFIVAGMLPTEENSLCSEIMALSLRASRTLSSVSQQKRNKAQHWNIFLEQVGCQLCVVEEALVEAELKQFRIGKTSKFRWCQNSSFALPLEMSIFGAPSEFKTLRYQCYHAGKVQYWVSGCIHCRNKQVKRWKCLTWLLWRRFFSCTGASGSFWGGTGLFVFSGSQK